MIPYFYLVFFTFSISYSMLPFHLVYVLQFLHLFFFLLFFLKPLSSVVKKLLYTYINMHNMYILENMNFCLIKKL